MKDGAKEEVDIRRLIRPHLLGIPGYAPVRPVEIVARELGLAPEDISKLDANENPYGASPRVAERLSRYDQFHIYPDPAQREMREAIGAYVGVDPEQVILGTGSDEMLDLAARLFVSPGDTVVNFPPTFGMYDFLASVYDAHLVEIPRNEDFTVDMAAAREALSNSAKLLVLASPNNPTGNVLPREQLLWLLDHPIVVVVDEAYAEFAGESAVELVSQHENLIVVRTFSKWAGLAGLRAGYAIIPLALAEVAWNIKIPYNQSVSSEQAILASLEDRVLLMDRVRLIVEERERLFRLLQELPFLRPFPSAANFVLCEVRGVPAQEVRDRLRERGILIRYFDSPGLRNCLRISVGLPRDTDRVLDALKEVGAKIGR
jgi:histidinol-phosphate aminotransferase